eukprot:TRINITY_DN9366_c0_g2_i1.p1 TRINITY_DN9366_c0_g2~~TRINITY_DN9366_c0_g2_i1.p1  ORF type:complete len:711 (-),score=106.16 TRINITY_DN9366_c0_g2_i1:258-2390(-)
MAFADAEIGNAEGSVSPHCLALEKISRITSEAGAAQTGEELHYMLPRHMWCVDQQDLRELREQVWSAICMGRIIPTELDPFDPQDDRTGPSIYTVTEQFIKRRTRKAGDCSWALMRHPEGLKCDLFITHAWSEGIFEFIDKVLYSWPNGATGAYCCMLSNPQNLDISALVDDPLDSPFYHALWSATHMLVVPNHKSSIYTRLWCVFEAHLAYRWGKIIVTATNSPHHAFFKSFWNMFFCFGLGALTGYSCYGLELHDKPCKAYDVLGCPSWCVFHEETLVSLATCDGYFAQTLFATGMLALLLLLLIASAMMNASRWHWATNRIGVLVGGFICGMFHLDVVAGSPEYWNLFLAALVFYVADLDRIRLSKFHASAKQLRSGLRSIEEACCSCAKDQERLQAVIAGSWANVAHTVHVLVKAGISTPAIRLADELGVEVDRAAFAQFTPSFVTWARWASVSVQSTARSQGGDFPICVLSVGLAVIWAVMWMTAARERQLWLSVTISKFLLFMWLPDEWFFAYREIRMAQVVVSCVIIVIATAGLQRIVAIPFIGPYLAQGLLAQRFRALRPSYWCLDKRARLLQPSKMDSPPKPTLTRSYSEPVSPPLRKSSTSSLTKKALSCSWPMSLRSIRSGMKSKGSLTSTSSSPIHRDVSAGSARGSEEKVTDKSARSSEELASVSPQPSTNDEGPDDCELGLAKDISFGQEVCKLSL